MLNLKIFFRFRFLTELSEMRRIGFWLSVFSVTLGLRFFQKRSVALYMLWWRDCSDFNIIVDNLSVLALTHLVFKYLVYPAPQPSCLHPHQRLLNQRPLHNLDDHLEPYFPFSTTHLRWFWLRYICSKIYHSLFSHSSNSQLSFPVFLD